MGDLKGIAKARMELEELYLGIPDDSVNLTFQDLANVNQNSNAQEKKKSTSMETIQDSKHASTLNKLPSLDFNRGLQESKNHHHNLRDHVSHDGHTFVSHRDHTLHHHSHHDVEAMHASHGPHHHHHHHHHRGYDQSDNRSHDIGNVGFRHTMESSKGYDDVSMMSMKSINSVYEKSRRPGIPHSNICTICSTYIYIFRHRCLVCGRVYCRSCVDMGMGEMTEGRKCIPCLGRRFSQRYIQRAGSVGCCTGIGYPSRVKQAELRWAEKGPRRRGEKGYGHSTVMSRPMTPTSPHVNSSPPSFVSNASFSPYSPYHHHLPL